MYLGCIIILFLLLYQYIPAKRACTYIYIYVYNLHQSQQYDLRKQKKKTLSKDTGEDIAVLSAGTIFIIRQRLALKRDC